MESVLWHSSEHKKSQKTTSSRATNSRKQLAVVQPTQRPNENITEAELKTQLDKMAANKARGPEYLPVEVTKLLKDTGTKWITLCFRKIMSKGIAQDGGKVRPHLYINRREILLIVVTIGLSNF